MEGFSSMVKATHLAFFDAPSPYSSPSTTRIGRQPGLERIMLDEPSPPSPPPVRRQILTTSVVLTLSNLALCMTRNSRVYLFEQAQCLLFYHSHGSMQVDLGSRIEEGLCKGDEIQYPLSVVVGVDTFLSLLPGKGLLIVT